MISYRPTGLKELQLVQALDMRAWPPRPPDQPIFYPVLTYDYAEKIARDWNSSHAAPENIGEIKVIAAYRDRARVPVEQLWPT